MGHKHHSEGKKAMEVKKWNKKVRGKVQGDKTILHLHSGEKMRRMGGKKWTRKNENTE